MSMLRRSLAMVLAALAGVSLTMATCGAGSCGGREIWVCLNPDTGKEDSNVYDANHYVNGVFDPCHCYDPCGPLPQCPMVVDAGPSCDAGTGGGH